MTPSIGVRRLSTRLCAMSSWASAFPGRPAIVPPSVSGISVQERVQMNLHAAQVLRERRCRLVPRRPDRAFVVHLLRDFHQPPFGLVQLLLVALLVMRHSHEPAVRGVAPAMVGTGEDRCIALVVATHLHAPMPAGVQEDMNPLLPVPDEDDRFLAHAGDEVVAGLGNLALVPDEEPAVGEELLLFLLVELLVDEELAADESLLHVDERRNRVVLSGPGHGRVPSRFYPPTLGQVTVCAVVPARARGLVALSIPDRREERVEARVERVARVDRLKAGLKGPSQLFTTGSHGAPRSRHSPDLHDVLREDHLFGPDQ